MLARGSKGSDVSELQLNLMKLGFNPGACSGFYDARTEEAVMIFQKENGIPISGITDRNTEERIYQLLRRMSVNATGNGSRLSQNPRRKCDRMEPSPCRTISP